MHFGIISPPVPGHLNPFGALGRELTRREHRVTVFHMPDVGDRVRSYGLEFVAIGTESHPRGTLSKSLARITELDGLAALRFTLGEVKGTTEMMLRDAPAALRDAKVDALLVDQTEPAGGTLAAHLGLPFITVCNALLLNREPTVPPAFADWDYSNGLMAQLRNRIGYAISDRALKPILEVIGRYRQSWRLPALRGSADSFSPLLQISQQVPAFDFPRTALPAVFHYAGPLRMDVSIEFPWERLDGRPVVYGSLGTQQNGKIDTFRLFAEACSRLPVQLVLAGLDPENARDFPGDPIIVRYAPQREVLAKASLTITHAGLNTVLDTLAAGVPCVAVPITYEQPAIASRLRWTGAGCALPFKRLTVDSLTGAAREVLANPVYRERAATVRTAIQNAGGVSRAADLIETALNCR